VPSVPRWLRVGSLWWFLEPQGGGAGGRLLRRSPLCGTDFSETVSKKAEALSVSDGVRALNRSFPAG
jgi:hypothetical protein